MSCADRAEGSTSSTDVITFSPGRSRTSSPLIGSASPRWNAPAPASGIGDDSVEEFERKLPKQVKLVYLAPLRGLDLESLNASGKQDSHSAEKRAGVRELEALTGLF